MRCAGGATRSVGVSETLRIPLRVVFYKEEGAWIAHCLEFDLIGDGETREEAMDQLGRAVLLQVEASVQTNNPANLFSPADGNVLRMFAAGNDIALAAIEFKEIHSANVQIDRAECREYLGTTPVCVLG
jgi:predicted RNase H-like HicB family nuclease